MKKLGSSFVCTRGKETCVWPEDARARVCEISDSSGSVQCQSPAAGCSSLVFHQMSLPSHYSWPAAINTSRTRTQRNLLMLHLTSPRKPQHRSICRRSSGHYNWSFCWFFMKQNSASKLQSSVTFTNINTNKQFFIYFLLSWEPWGVQGNQSLN